MIKNEEKCLRCAVHILWGHGSRGNSWGKITHLPHEKFQVFKYFIPRKIMNCK